MSNRHFILYSFLFFVPNFLFSQLPNTTLYHAKILNHKENSLTVSQIYFLSGDNPKGYNNQPYFVSNSEVLISSKTSNSRNTDIFYLNLDTKEKRKITSSPDSEYSPRLSNNSKTEFTVVKVPATDSNSQFLVRYSLVDGKEKELLLTKHGKIGYYRYLNENTWVCFIVDTPNVLAICNEKSMNRNIFASEIGRTFEIIENKKVLFVHKILEHKWVLKEYNIEDRKMTILADMPIGREDFMIMPDGRIVCANDSKLLTLNVNTHSWKELVDFAPLHIHKINRICMNGENLVFVSVND